MQISRKLKRITTLGVSLITLLSVGAPSISAKRVHHHYRNHTHRVIKRHAHHMKRYHHKIHKHSYRRHTNKKNRKRARKHAHRIRTYRGIPKALCGNWHSNSVRYQQYRVKGYFHVSRANASGRIYGVRHFPLGHIYGNKDFNYHKSGHHYYVVNGKVRYNGQSYRSKFMAHVYRHSLKFNLNIDGNRVLSGYHVYR